MNKRILCSHLFVMASMCIALEVDAQNLGSLLKKAIEKLGTSSSKKSVTPQGNNLMITQGPGISVINPLARFINVEPVGLLRTQKMNTLEKPTLC